jgi:hypothetical protein
MRVFSRRGSALLWVIVFVAVVTAIAASAAPYLAGDYDRTRVDSTARILRDLGVAINNMEAGVGRKFPGRPSQVTNALTAAGNYRIMSCWNNTYSGADSTTWTTVAPFAAFYVPTNGLWTPLGRIRDSVENRAGNQNSAFIWLDIPAVPGELALMLDLSVDGAIGNTTDTVQYNAPVNDTTTVRYRVTPRELGRC